MADELDYPTHLQLSVLLNTQKPLSYPAENDELFFIIIHQAYELWFKLILHEIDKIKNGFSNNNIYICISGWNRCRLILETIISQFDVLKTMTPRDFNEFRGFLKNASGLQSYQFRAIEFVLGYKRKNILYLYESYAAGYNMLISRLNSRSVIDHFYDFLEQNCVVIPLYLRERDVTLPHTPDKIIQNGILELYTKDPTFESLIEGMINFDETYSKWRYVHWKTVERMIGNKIGTGGSTEADRNNNLPSENKFRMSVFLTFFQDLWEIRDKL